ncbi:family 16 glycosylhydrolase [Carboxylicivirga mesophila]|uniref:Family 16 glycosylhydrolase n=1 Tax=Carboxylicivirga mesophila TaxID=1166478 RepID=A0ABS5KFS8_9BACT|nr:family 16 glycosylhydrolase [Carboxylicivirga mesophila]MBS2213876.1 family 16 glycosylhydrolase [Carboxylicivirga mesophila]
MKVKLLGLLLWICTLQSIGQTAFVQDDFEGNGTINSWYGDDCNIDIAFANPKQEGINTSSTVLKYHDVGGQYANVRFDVSNNFNLETNHTFSFKIYVPSDGMSGNQTNQVSVKLQDGTIGAPWSTQSEIIKPITLDAWQELSFDFMNDPFINIDPTSDVPSQRADFNRVLIQVNGENNTDPLLAYIDDFSYDGSIAADPVYDQLVWSDEFDGNGDIDQGKWFRQYQLPIGGGWYNGEVQHYTNRPDNSYIENGVLKIVAKKENFTDQGVTKNYTSARLNSKFAFTYGKVEVRAKLPSGAGTWPAIWMLGKNINEDGAYWDNEGYGTTPWPACGEIDIMEHWGDNQNYVQSATHTPSSYGGTINHGGQMIATASSQFHIYTLLWTPEKLVFSVDDIVHYTYQPGSRNADTWPFDLAQYLILNVAVQAHIDPNFQEGAMEIDYVRIYQAGTSTTIAEPQMESCVHVYPNPFRDEMNIVLKDVTTNQVELRIFNANGILLRSYTKGLFNKRVRLDDIGFLTRGIYLFQFEFDDKVECLKVIKE